MTPEQKIKAAILAVCIRKDWIKPVDYPITADNVEELYEDLLEAEELHWDAQSEFRCGQVETNIPAPHSRHYESKSVAAQLPDGSWIGWTYWYGGGKHGNPEEVGWMDEAYDLNCQEEEKKVIVRTFTKPTIPPVEATA